jgi:heme A synthase
MTDPVVPARPVPRWLHAWAILTVAVTVVLLVLGQLVTTFRAGMADPVWPTEPWYLLNNYRFDLGYLIEHTHRIAGFTVGGVVSVLALGLWLTEPRKAARWVGLIALVVLLGAFGEFHRSLMGQREIGVAVQVPHRAVGMMLGGLLVVLGLGISGFATKTRGTGLRLLGVVGLVAVMVQGLLGGFRVKLNAMVGTDLAAVHGVFAQVVFAVLVSLAVLTARPPSVELPAATRRVLGRLSVALVGLLLVQLVWGALVRHSPTPLTQRLHFLFAFLVVAAGVWLLRAAFADPVGRRRLAAAGWLIGVLLAAQVLLGVEAWMGKFGTFVLPELEAKIAPEKATIRTLHTLVGTGILATAVVLAIQSLRNSGSGSESGRKDEAEATVFSATVTATATAKVGETA